jgi:Tectonin domain
MQQEKLKRRRKMKNENTLFNHNSSTLAPWRNRIGRLTLVALLVCGFAAEAPAQWTLVPTSPTGVNLAGIQAGTQLWGRDSSGKVYEDIGGTLTLIDPSGAPTFAHITVGVGSTPFWGLTSGGDSYFYNGSEFVNVPVPEALTSIAAGGEGVWAVSSSSGHVYQEHGLKSWEPPATGEPSEFFESISAGNFTIGPWALDNKGNAWLFNNITGFFDGPIAGIPGGITVTQVAVGDSETWAIASGSSDNVFLYDFNPAVESFFQPYLPYGSATLSTISAGTDENVWGVNAAGQVYQYSPSKVEFLLAAQPPEPVFTIKVGSAGIFALSTGTGHVYQYK